MQPTPEQYEIVKNSSTHHTLDFALVCAVIEQESNWNTWAFRAEPAFDERYVKPLHKTPTEEWARSISWGPMQVMGETAREMHFDGEYLSELNDFQTGVEYGCLKLLKCLDRNNGDRYKALQRYNGGSNPIYAEQVVARMPKYLTVPNPNPNPNIDLSAQDK